MIEMISPFPEDAVGKHFAPMLKQKILKNTGGIFVPYVDHFLSELLTRFTQLNKMAIQGLLFLPSNLPGLTDEKLVDIHKHFSEALPAPETFKQEVKLWKLRWSCCSTPVPNSLSHTLELVNSKAYPNIFTVLMLLLVVPVTAATVE